MENSNRVIASHCSQSQSSSSINVLVLFAVGKRSELNESVEYQLEDREEPTENITFQLNLVSRARLKLFCLTLYFICTCSHGSCIFIAMKMIGYLHFLYCLLACLLADQLAYFTQLYTQQAYYRERESIFSLFRNKRQAGKRAEILTTTS